RRGCAQGQVSARGPQVKRKPPAILRIHGLAAYLGTVPRRRSPMIPRYARPEMTAIWSPETKFRIWYEIEAHACDAQAELGVIPRENAEAVWKARDVQFDVARIDEIEAVTKHDVIAFLTHLAEHIGA